MFPLFTCASECQQLEGRRFCLHYNASGFSYRQLQDLEALTYNLSASNRITNLAKGVHVTNKAAVFPFSIPRPVRRCRLCRFQELCNCKLNISGRKIEINKRRMESEYHDSHYLICKTKERQLIASIYGCTRWRKGL
jgi:CRISPR/Cas system-associated exonuclease Cas4 (RecB family)